MHRYRSVTMMDLRYRTKLACSTLNVEYLNIVTNCNILLSIDANLSIQLQARTTLTHTSFYELVVSL